MFSRFGRDAWNRLQCSAVEHFGTASVLDEGEAGRFLLCGKLSDISILATKDVCDIQDRWRWMSTEVVLMCDSCAF